MNIFILFLMFISIYQIGVTSGYVESKEETCSCQFSDLTIKETTTYAEVTLQGTNCISIKEGYYQVPTYREIFQFPSGTEIIRVKCNPKHLHTQTITKPLSITPNPKLVNNEFVSKKTLNSSSIQTIDYWYQYTIGHGLGETERNTLVALELFPLHFNQNDYTIQWVETIDITITYNLPDQNPSTKDDYSLAIIAPEEFKNDLVTFLDHKNQLNISTILVTLEEIYEGTIFPAMGRDHAEQIKYFVKEAIEEWGIKNVLLIGSADKLPARNTHVFVEYFNHTDLFPSDLYYADIYDAHSEFCSWDSNNNNVFGEYNWGTEQLTDDIDLYPDVFLGRLACADQEEVRNCVHKIMEYEDTSAHTQEWFFDLVVIGGDTFTDDTWMIDEGEYVNQQAIDILQGFIPRRIWISNEILTEFTGLSDLSNAINQGCGFVDFSGHGSPVQWACHPHGNEKIWLPKPVGYFNQHVSLLQNNEKLPIIVLGACSTCQFTADDRCFGWSFVAHPTGGGIASFGVTTWGYAAGGGKKITEGLIESITLSMFEIYADSNSQGQGLTLGQLWEKSLYEFIHPDMDEREYRTVESWQPFCDPTITISERSQPPLKPQQPDGPSQCKLRTNYTFSSRGDDPDGDHFYYLFDWGDGTTSRWLGPYESGSTIEETHSWEEKGRYNVRVKIRDENGVQSPWSEPLKISLLKSTVPRGICYRISELFPRSLRLLHVLLGYLEVKT